MVFGVDENVATSMTKSLSSIAGRAVWAGKHTKKIRTTRKCRDGGVSRAGPWRCLLTAAIIVKNGGALCVSED